METMYKVKSFIYSGEGARISSIGGNMFELEDLAFLRFGSVRFKSRGYLRSLTALHSACRSYTILYYVYLFVAEWSLISYSDALATGFVRSTTMAMARFLSLRCFRVIVLVPGVSEDIMDNGEGGCGCGWEKGRGDVRKEGTGYGI